MVQYILFLQTSFAFGLLSLAFIWPQSIYKVAGLQLSLSGPSLPTRQQACNSLYLARLPTMQQACDSLSDPSLPTRQQVHNSLYLANASWPVQHVRPHLQIGYHQHRSWGHWGTHAPTSRWSHSRGQLFNLNYITYKSVALPTACNQVPKDIRDKCPNYSPFLICIKIMTIK